MTKEVEGKLTFEVETKRIIEILSNEIYDSPLALLRENAQNGYDAILMRASKEDRPITDFRLLINIDSKKIEIEDDGIGMDKNTLANNFWKAGASGKRGELAKEAGVIGTFGIGAMANFGVCTKLVVETRHVDSKDTLISSAEREKLSISEPCIDFNSVEDERTPGSKVVAYLDETSTITPQSAKQYLCQYVQFLPIPVLLNGELISKKTLDGGMGNRFAASSSIAKVSIDAEGYKADVDIFVDANSLVAIKAKNLKVADRVVNGELVLQQNYGTVLGLRNYFGLSPIPISSQYNLSGIANLSFLQPTAGRESISRDSIDIVNQIIRHIERKITEVISETKHADNNVHFMQHVLKLNRIDLAGSVTIDVLPHNEKTPLSKIMETFDTSKTYYYTGRDPSTITQFSSGDSHLLLVSQSNPRRKIHIGYLRTQLAVEQVPDEVRIDKIYSPAELLREEVALQIKATNCLIEDYLLPDVEVLFADISHKVNVRADRKEEKVRVFIRRNCAFLKPVLEIYHNSYTIFSPFVKDFVRNYIYPHIQNFVPSSTKQGAEALRRVLAQKRELYKYEWSDVGEIESLISEFMAKEISFGEVLRKGRTVSYTQTQRVRNDQVGVIESEIPDLSDNVPQKQIEEIPGAYGAAPSILRTDKSTKMKVLITDKARPQLNDFHSFLALSDRVFRREYDFFLQPHSTKIIWGSHRIIYIFTHSSNLLTLYYNIELKQRLDDDSAGGGSFPTTTIAMKNRIFIPIPDKFTEFFRISQGTREFFVNYDTIGE
jgi:molecular chaperone HtpG